MQQSLLCAHDVPGTLLDVPPSVNGTTRVSGLTSLIGQWGGGRGREKEGGGEARGTEGELIIKPMGEETVADSDQDSDENRTGRGSARTRGRRRLLKQAGRLL